jgi:hypothetical protein
MLLGLLGALLRGRFELRDPVRSGLQCLLLNKHGLRQHIRRVGRGANRVIDEGFRFGVTLGRGGRIDALEKATKHLAFFGGHVALPAAGWPRPRYNDACGQSKSTTRFFASAARFS